MGRARKSVGQVRETAARYAAGAGFGASAYAPGARPTRKNFYLHQAKIDLARKILGVETETEAIDTALDLLIYGEALATGTTAMKGEEYDDVLGIGQEVPER